MGGVRGDDWVVEALEMGLSTYPRLLPSRDHFSGSTSMSLLLPGVFSSPYICCSVLTFVQSFAGSLLASGYQQVAVFLTVFSESSGSVVPLSCPQIYFQEWLKSWIDFLLHKHGHEKLTQSSWSCGSQSQIYIHSKIRRCDVVCYLCSTASLTILLAAWPIPAPWQISSWDFFDMISSRCSAVTPPSLEGSWICH